jgi:hypothetical protein
VSGLHAFRFVERGLALIDVPLKLGELLLANG